MKPGILPTPHGLYQAARKLEIRTEAGTLLTCVVCERKFPRPLRFKPTFGKRPAGFIPGDICSPTCRERALQAAKR